MIGLRSSSASIGIVIRARDEFTSTARKVSRELNDTYGSARRVMRDNMVAARNFGVAMTVAGAAGLGFFKESLSVGSEFYYTMAGTKAVTQATTKEYQNMVKVARELSTRSVYNNRKIADAMKYMGMAGFNPTQINQTIEAITALGAATDYRISGKGGVADYMTNIMTSFGLRADQSMRAADIMTKGITKANVDIDDIHDALRYSAADLVTVGTTLEEATSLIAVLGNAGIRGSMAGTAIGNMVQKLAKGIGEFRTTRQSKILESIGLTPQDVMKADGNMKSIISIIETFKKRIEPHSNLRQLNLIEGFFGRRGARSFAAAMRDPELGNNLREMYNIIQAESPGSALKIANERIDNLYGKTLMLKDTWVEVQTSIHDALEPIATKIVVGLRKALVALNKFIKTPLGSFLVKAAAGLSAILLVGGAIMAAVSSLGILIFTTEFSFKKLASTAKWAWATMRASMTQYYATHATLAKRGAIYDSFTGRYRSARSGRMVSKAVGERYFRMYGGGFGFGGFGKGVGKKFGKVGKFFKIGKLGKFAGFMSRAGGLLARVVPLLGRFASALLGPIGIIAGIVVSLLGFKRTMQILLIPLRMTGAILLTIVKFFTNGFRLGKAWNDSKEIVFAKEMEAQRQREKVRRGYQQDRIRDMISSMPTHWKGQKLDPIVVNVSGTQDINTSVDMDGEKLGQGLYVNELHKMISTGGMPQVQ